MEGKKISFGFMKVQKAVKNVEEEKKDYIECLEGKAIKVKGGDEIEEKPPIIIPMQPNTITTAADRLKKIAEEVESCMDLPEPGAIKTEPEDSEETNGKETLDQLAVKELLKESKKEIKVETQELTVPVPDKPSLQGSKESTLEDYESIPIQEFGKAMLRGMGWQPGKEQTADLTRPTQENMASPSTSTVQVLEGQQDAPPTMTVSKPKSRKKRRDRNRVSQYERQLISYITAREQHLMQETETMRRVTAAINGITDAITRIADRLTEGLIN